MKRALVSCLGLLVVSVLVACGSTMQPRAGELIVTETSLATGTPLPTALHVAPTRTPAPVASQPNATKTPRSTSTPVQNPPTETPFQICSPLALQTIAELHEIVSDPYDPPPPGHEERHHGVDFSYYRRGGRLSILGEGVQSVFPGWVAAAIQNEYPYGNMVIVETPGGDLPVWLAEQLQVEAGESLYLLYAHFGEAPLVELGEVVEACQPLGEVGKSGDFNVEHLHLETRIGPAGGEFASMAYYHSRTTAEQRGNYELWRTSGVYRHFDPMVLITLAVGDLETSDQSLMP